MKRHCTLWGLLVCVAGVWVSPASGHVQLNFPNGGEQLEVGSVVTINWQILIAHSLQNWDLWYSTTGSNGPWIVIAEDLAPGSGSVGSIHTYDWTIPDAVTSQGRVRVRMDNTGTDYEDISNADFSILDVDNTPPSPDPMTFDSLPTPLDTMAMTMTATEATDDTLPIEYQFDFVTGALGGTDSAWQESTTYVDGGLFPNSSYTYRVKARDGLDPPNETDWSAEHEAATDIETPTLPLFVSATSSSSIDVVVLDALTNLTLGSSGVYFDSTTAGGDGGINQWVQTIIDSATGLEPDTLYSFRVKARNLDGVETEYGPETSKATLANVPGTPALDALACDSMAIEVDANGNPSNTSFAIQCSATDPMDTTWDGMYVDANGDPTGSPTWQTISDWETITVLGLTQETTYTFQVAALNQDGVETDLGPASAEATGTCGACEGDANGDGVVDPLDTGFVLARFGCDVGGGDSTCDAADQNGDGAVDPLDVGFILARFGTCP